MTLRLHQGILRRVGIEPLLAEDEAIALNYLAEDNQLLLLTRSRHLLLEIRNREDLADVLIIIASSDTSIKESVLEEGANAFLILPFSRNDILKCIKSLK